MSTPVRPSSITRLPRRLNEPSKTRRAIVDITVLHASAIERAKEIAQEFGTKVEVRSRRRVHS